MGTFPLSLQRGGKIQSCDIVQAYAPRSIYIMSSVPVYMAITESVMVRFAGKTILKKSYFVTVIQRLEQEQKKHGQMGL